MASNDEQVGDYELAETRINMYETALESGDPKADTIATWAASSTEHGARGYGSDVNPEAVGIEVRDLLSEGQIDEARAVVNQLQNGTYSENE